jgi:hypothetical protein
MPAMAEAMAAAIASEKDKPKGRIDGIVTTFRGKFAAGRIRRLCLAPRDRAGARIGSALRKRLIL